MKNENQKLGAKGEEIALKFLKENKYKILEKNYKSKLGEIDIIAKEKDSIVFIEVKTRKNENFGLAKESVSYTKQKKISNLALHYIKEKKLENKNIRFDIVAIQYENNIPKIEIIKNAFDYTE